MSSSVASKETVYLIVLFLLVVAACAVGVVCTKSPVNTSTVQLDDVVLKRQIGPWVVIGTGLTAASLLHSLRSDLFDAMTVRESNESIGGRAMSTTMAITLPSTISPAREYGAWVFIPFTHVGVRRLLSAVNVPVIPVELRTPYSFIYDNGKRRALGVLPSSSGFANKTFAQVASKDPALWFAHTGMWVKDCGEVPAETIYGLNAPIYGDTVAGFGWQSVIMQIMGRTPIRYNFLLDEIELRGDGKIGLKYASGNHEVADGVVLTMSPVQIQSIKGFPESFQTTVQTSFVPVSVGVLYAAWASQDSWWSALGYMNGLVATDLPVGRMVIVSPFEIRFSMSGAEHVSFWTKIFIEDGADAACAEIAKQLSTVFGKSIPAPASAVFKGWPNAVTFWKGKGDKSMLYRPFGPRAPVFWASSDISDHAGWVGGAVSIGDYTASQIEQYITQ